MSGITCHVLDTSLGRPAAGIPVRLERRGPTGRWQLLGEATTNSDGRVAHFEPSAAVQSAAVQSAAVQNRIVQSPALDSMGLDSAALDSAALDSALAGSAAAGSAAAGSAAAGNPVAGSGEHRIRFDTKAYFERRGQPVFYPRVEVTFVIASASEHHHIPLLLAPFGYSTYRGS
jgi:5-hydroxyisourate hydrolase